MNNVGLIWNDVDVCDPELSSKYEIREKYKLNKNLLQRECILF
jgi:hypothetical protein